MAPTSTSDYERKKKINLEQVSILIAEDDENIRDLLTLFLEYLGAKVDLAQDGLQGLEKAKNSHFDIILMDLNLPKMNGERITEELRKSNNKIPIIGLSAYDDEFRKKKCLQNGFNEYVSKPFEMDDLVEKIKIQTSNKK
jgi:DNA-binding response OmpR family regulator